MDGHPLEFSRTKPVMTMNSQPQNPHSKLWTAADVSQHFRVSRRCITNWINARIIPCVRVGRVLRFDPERVREALARYERQEITR